MMVIADQYRVCIHASVSVGNVDHAMPGLGFSTTFTCTDSQSAKISSGRKPTKFFAVILSWVFTVSMKCSTLKSMSASPYCWKTTPDWELATCSAGCCWICPVSGQANMCGGVCRLSCLYCGTIFSVRRVLSASLSLSVSMLCLANWDDRKRE